ncbi:MAG: amidohydrolase family protein [Phycisphaeraceae bacterium]|nr:amidohydrolase family protein [Phycisphaeraceae bacterium]
MTPARTLTFLLSCAAVALPSAAQIAVKGRSVYTMDENAPGSMMIENGVVVITAGKIAAVGPAATTLIPEGYTVIEAAVVTPGLFDARCTVGVSGVLNQRQDQDQLERSGPVQPELRAIDAFNPDDTLVGWMRSLGVTMLHTGHAPGELVSGQTSLIKATGRPVDEAVVVETAAVAVTLSPWAQRSGGSSPGTRAKMVAMLREELLKAQDAERKAQSEQQDDAAIVPENKGEKAHSGLRAQVMQRVIRREVPLLVTANRAQDIAAALRIAQEFNIRMILDSGAESYLLAQELRAANVPVFIHPMMARAYGEMENMSTTTPAALLQAGVPVALQGGYESYVPKSRVVLFEAAIAAANGLTFEQALATITSRPADILGVSARVGRLRPGLDADLALFEADPFEYLTRCIGVVIDGRPMLNDTPK